MRNMVDYNMIEKRAKCLSSTYEMASCMNHADMALKTARDNSPVKKGCLKRLLNECKCKNNANMYGEYCLETIALMEYGEQNQYMNTFLNEVLPYIENVDWVERISPRFEGMTSDNKYDLAYYAKCYGICDRISNNHKLIQEQFDLDGFIETKRNKNMKYIASKICDTIYENTDGSSACERLSIALEESSYLLQKYHIEYDRKKLVKYVTEYFLMKPDLTEQDYNAFKNVLNEHSMINETDLSSIRYFTESFNNSKSNIDILLNEFILSETKDVHEDFGGIINKSLTFSNLKEDFVNNFDNVLEFVQDHLLNERFDIKEVINTLNDVPKIISEQMKYDTWVYTRKDLDKLTKHYSMALESVESEFVEDTDKKRVSKLIKLKDCYTETINLLNEFRGLVYTDDNISQMSEMTTLVESSHAYYLNEFKIFKFQNLIRAAVEAEKFIKGKGKKLMDKIAGKLIPSKKRSKNIIETSLYGSFTEMDTSDICICSFDIVDENYFFEVHDVMTEMCRQLNQNILRSDDLKAYYVVKPDTVEIRIECASTVLLTDEELKEVNESFCTEDMMRCLELDEMATELESVDIDQLSSIVSQIESKLDTITDDQFCTIIEASQFVDIITKDDIDRIFESYMGCGNSKHISIHRTSSIRRSVDEWVHEEAPLSIQVEACNIISSLLESEDEKKKINKEKQKEKDKENKKSIKDKIKDKFSSKDKKEDTDEKKEKKNPLAGVNLTSLKLYTKGLKAKMKDMSNKEKQWSKNVDINFNHLYKACKDMLVSDRREAIIRGSIIPSFSKCVKLGIGVAGLTFINPVAAAVAVIGGVAMSKNLTRKERMLLLDEISTELEVVEKEISIAEGKNNMKKYRRLLQYKKDLQRQYQRIRYNIRIGKDLLPGSTTGMKDTN